MHVETAKTWLTGILFPRRWALTPPACAWRMPADLTVAVLDLAGYVESTASSDCASDLTGTWGSPQSA